MEIRAALKKSLLAGFHHLCARWLGPCKRMPLLQVWNRYTPILYIAWNSQNAKCTRATTSPSFQPQTNQLKPKTNGLVQRMQHLFHLLVHQNPMTCIWSSPPLSPPRSNSPTTPKVSRHAAGCATATAPPAPVVLRFATQNLFDGMLKQKEPIPFCRTDMN